MNQSRNLAVGLGQTSHATPQALELEGLLRLIESSVTLPSETHTTFQHANVVKFVYYALEIHQDCEPLTLHIVQQAGSGLLQILVGNDYIMLVRRGQLRDVERHWTGTTDEVIQGDQHQAASEVENIVKVFTIFKTFLDPNTWQITRSIFCLFWSAETITTLSRNFETALDQDFSYSDAVKVPDLKLMQEVQQLRNLSGRESVAFARRNLEYVLLSGDGRSSDVEWQLPSRTDIRDAMIQ